MDDTITMIKIKKTDIGSILKIKVPKYRSRVALSREFECDYCKEALGSDGNFVEHGDYETCICDACNEKEIIYLFLRSNHE